ncbi:hypothetical protein K439DRAFT_1611471 [Ramaria rubella]|nr:hypothetical protein K439DRAFT_1611471 [Ramaria rubella]
MAEDNLTYWPLDYSDLWMRSLAKGHELGDGTRQELWIWTMGVSGARGLEKHEEWENDAQWIESAGSAHGLIETTGGKSRMCDVWSQLAAECDDSAVGVGRKAYAYQQAAMYRTIAANCQNRFEEAQDKSGSNDQWKE